MKQADSGGKKNSKVLPKVIVPIVGALIGAAAVIIGTVIAYRASNYFSIDIRVYDGEGAPVEARVLITGDSGQTPLNRRTDREGRLVLDKLRNGQYQVLASAAGYDPAEAEFDQRDKQVNITMNKTAVAAGSAPFPLPAGAPGADSA
jgi:hypothetical protein